jgi:hypothetical protein
MCRLSRNLGASNSWNPVGLFRPVMGLLYLYITETEKIIIIIIIIIIIQSLDWHYMVRRYSMKFGRRVLRM